MQKVSTKKKIAFIMAQMNQGGPARGLLNISEIIDYEKFELTLILLKRGGELFQEIPDNVIIKIAEPPDLFEDYSNGLHLNKLIWIIINYSIRVFAKILKLLFIFSDNNIWLLKKPFIKKITENYDLAMSLVEGQANYFLADFINASLKVGRIPTDYRTAKLDANFDRIYFKKYDFIATNSIYNLNVLREIFPEFSSKFLYIDTIINPSSLYKKAEEGVGFDDDFDGKRIVTLSRFEDSKGIDLAIKACRILIKFGNQNIRWYIFGRGDKTKYFKLIKDFELEKTMFLMEPVSNPYPYVKQAYIYVQPSTYEGSSNAVKEAKTLNKPVVLTNFNTAKEHVTHMVDGIIAEDISDISLAKSIQMLLSSPELICEIENNLRNSMKSNIDELNKILNLLNE